jgi:outer membrane protein assembly factor BamB
VDAAGVYVFWTEEGDSEALALDLQGNVRWRTAFGPFEAQHGSGASPALIGGVLVLPKENLSSSSFLAGVDPETGKELWRIPRPGQREPYVTPMVRSTAEGEEAVYASTTFGLTGFDPKTGAERWKFDPGFKERCVGSPVIMGEVVFTATGQGGGGRESVAVRVGAEGEVKELYRIDRGLPYVPTPVYHDGLLFLMSDGGILACHRAADGEELWRERVCGPVYSSPLCINGVIHVFSRQGEIVTVRAAERFEKLAEASVEEEIRATPAVADDRLYVRTMTRMICFGKR